MRTFLPNFVGFLVSIVLAGIVFGAQLESLFFPIVVGPRLTNGEYLPSPTISNVLWKGQGPSARLWWQLDFCKKTSAILVNTGYTFWYIRSPEVPGVPIQVRNETTQSPAGTLPLPTGCLRVQYSAKLPENPPPQQGDYILSQAVFQSPHGFWWDIRVNFGTVVVPEERPQG